MQAARPRPEHTWRKPHGPIYRRRAEAEGPERIDVEYPDEMTEGYRKALIVQLLVQADTELVSAPAYFGAAEDAPSTNTMVSATAIIQDELAHANIAYRLLEDLGMDEEQPSGRQPHEFKHPYGFDHALRQLGRAGGGQRLLRPRRDHSAGRRLQEHLLRPAQARPGEGGPGGDLPPPPRRDVDEAPLGSARVLALFTVLRAFLACWGEVRATRINDRGDKAVAINVVSVVVAVEFDPTPQADRTIEDATRRGEVVTVRAPATVALGAFNVAEGNLNL